MVTKVLFVAEKVLFGVVKVLFGVVKVFFIFTKVLLVHVFFKSSFHFSKVDFRSHKS